MHFKQWHFYFSFFLGIFAYRAFSFGPGDHVNLNALTPEEIAQMGTNFFNLDFSVTKGKLPTAILKGKDVRWSKFCGLDLKESGIEQATELIGADFSDAINLPQCLARGRDFIETKLKGQDLTHLCIAEATSLSQIDFEGSSNAPHGMAQGQNLILATLGNMDLNWIKLDQADNYRRIHIASDVTLSKPILLEREWWVEEWSFYDNTIDYKRRPLDHEAFLKRVRFWNKLAKEGVPEALLALAEEKLLSTGQSIEAIMDQTAPYGGVNLFTTSDLENFIQKELPPPCSSNYPPISSFSIASNWEGTILKNIFDIEKKKFYLDLIRGCNECGVVSDIKTQQRNAPSRRDYTFTYLSIPLEASLKDKLAIYLKHIKESTNRVKIIYEGRGQKGQDQGGLRRQFFDEISEYIRDEVLSGKNTDYNTPANSKLIGKAIWRMRFYEKGIPGISLGQDLKFYEALLRPEEKAGSAKVAHGQRLGQFVAYGLCSDKAEEIKKSITILNQLRVDYIEEDINDYKNPCKQGPEEEHRNPFNFLSSLVQSFQYQQKCFGAQCKVNLAPLNAAQLKLLIEGESVISPEDFLNSLVPYSPMTQEEGERHYPEYRAAIEELVGEKMSKGEEVEQEFLRHFLWYVTGTSSFQKGTPIHLDVYEDNTASSLENPFAHTCSNRLDCPFPKKIKGPKKRKQHIKKTIKKTIKRARREKGFDGA